MPPPAESRKCADGLIAVPTVGDACLVTLSCGHRVLWEPPVYYWLPVPCGECMSSGDQFYPWRHAVGCARRVQ